MSKDKPVKAGTNPAKSNRGALVSVGTDAHPQWVDPSQIAAIESRGDATTIHLTGGSIINVPRPLDDFAASLGLAS